MTVTVLHTERGINYFGKKFKATKATNNQSSRANKAGKGQANTVNVQYILNNITYSHDA